MEIVNRLCVECEVQPAEVFCTCTEKEIYLCEECLLKHSKTRTRKGHPTWRVSDLLLYKDPHYFDRFEAFPNFKAQAEQGILQVDKAIEEYRAVVETVLRDVAAASEITIAKLISIKTQLSEDVKTAIDEVGKTLSESQPQLQSKYGSAFRSLVEKPKPFQLFEFAHPTCSVPLQSLIILNSNLPLPNELLADDEEGPRVAPAANPNIWPKPPLPVTFFDTKRETPEQAVAHYMESIQICDTHFPHSTDLALCRTNLGNLYMELNQWDQAEAQLALAKAVYKAHYPLDISYAKCLNALGLLHYHKKQYKPSERHFQHAICICSTGISCTIEFSIRIYEKTYLPHSMKFRMDGEVSLVQAIQKHNPGCPLSINYVIFLTNLGILLKEMGKMIEAENNLFLAFKLYQTHFPNDSSFAYNMKHLGLLYEQTKREGEEVEDLLAALQLYEENKGQANARAAI